MIVALPRVQSVFELIAIGVYGSKSREPNYSIAGSSLVIRWSPILQGPGLEMRDWSPQAVDSQGFV